MKTVWLSIILITLSVTMSNSQSPDFDSCETLVQSFPTANVAIVLRSTMHCPIDWFIGNGFIIEQTDSLRQNNKILWGEATVDAERVYSRIHDFDHDSVNEVMTLFAFEGSFWGYIHEPAIDSSGALMLTTTRIPDSAFTTIDAWGDPEYWGDTVALKEIDSPAKCLLIYFDSVAGEYRYVIREEPQ